MQKQVAFERFLVRLFHGDGLRWVLNGGYALELRMPGTARAFRHGAKKNPGVHHQSETGRGRARGLVR